MDGRTINGLMWQRLTRDVRIEAIGTEVDGPDPLGELARCHQCGQCAGVCPSQRHGGIRPADSMVKLHLSLLRPDAPELWLCAMCNSCTERCQLGVSPSDRIQEMRGRATLAGHCPKSFQEEAKLFMRTGLAFPNSGLTKKWRKELGLTELASDAKTLEDLTALVKATTLGRAPLER